MTRILLLALAASALAGCEVSMNVRYDFSAAPGHSVGAEFTVHRSTP